MMREITLDRRQLLMGASVAAATAAAATAARSESAAGAPDLSGKAILVTGSSSGFGRLGAEHYARLGAKVFATMRDLPRREADELRDLAASDKLDIAVIEIDVRSDELVSAGVAAAEAAAGRPLDVLVNNAGVAYGGPVEVQDMEATRNIFETNVFGCHRMARAVLPGMRSAGAGQIFQIASQLGRLVLPGYGLYSGTKFALEALSEQMAYELAPHGIDVTVIEPGGYPTEIWENSEALTTSLFERTDKALMGAYPALTALSGGGGGSTDPMDVPRAIADIIAMPKGARPLRRAVHPTSRPQEKINAISAETQVAWLGGSPFGPWIKDVNNVGK
ncbi:MAG: SDR family NAD(P)-dependent oxidoreductase [Alphaproteobacteria bacterium]|nr:SDR family NAD(P)-dependent oxidoreductase [Alphaproteobacteria bacterium]